jgi:D-beta-D-heptose 7-phosphate kinase / D-beta-D-heptose 1-phosphate adenosyltransferase
MRNDETLAGFALDEVLSENRKGGAMSGSLIDVVASLGKPRVLVIGDVMLDKYVWGDANRISPEAPIPVLLVREQETRLGNAGNVVNNLVGFGVQASCCGVVGDDADGRLLTQMLDERCKASGGRSRLWVDPRRPTTVKTRFVGYVQSPKRAMHQMLRVDSEDSTPISNEMAAEMVQFIRKLVPDQDAVVLSDVGKGLLTDILLHDVITACREAKVPVIVDPRIGHDCKVYRGATVVKGNRYETQLATGMTIKTEEDMLRAAQKLHGDLALDAVVITLDRDGIFLYDGPTLSANGKMHRGFHVPTQPREVYDVTGAGDIVASVLAATIGAHVGYRQAVELANIAAGIEVGKLGAAQVGREEIVAELRSRERGVPDKLKNLAELLGLLEDRRRRKEKIVFTNGCFDILHMGHIDYLRFARRQGDLLVLGLNSDSSVRGQKGPNRPILKQEERARVLAALADVDLIVMFDEPTPDRLIREVRPDVLVKGEDWRAKGVVGQDFVESYGGKVVLAPLVQGVSTTDIVSRILDRYAGNSKGDK